MLRIFQTFFAFKNCLNNLKKRKKQYYISFEIIVKQEMYLITKNKITNLEKKISTSITI